MGLEWAPKGPYLAYHKELPAAERAVEAARASGKDRECPDEFKAAEKLMNDAYATYWACRTQEAIAMANDAASRANALCPKKVEAPPPPPPPAAPAPQPVERLTLHINFDSDSAVIRPAERAELQKAIDFVNRYPGRKISIEGHTDSTGSASHNQDLSERRAAAVKDYLLQNGVTDGGRITTVGYGPSRPVADNATQGGRFQNRRVEVVILP